MGGIIGAGEAARCAARHGEQAMFGLNEIIRRILGGRVAASGEARAARSAAEHLMEGERLLGEGQAREALAEVALVLESEPGNSRAHRVLATAYQRAGDAERSREHLLQAADLEPTERLVNLAAVRALREANDPAAALARLARLEASFPEDAELALEWGRALRDAGRYDEAIARLERVTLARPEYVEALDALAGLHRDRGEVDIARALYKRIARLRPESPIAGSALLFIEQYRDHDRETLFRRHVEWGERFGGAAAAPHDNSREPERPLRVGYLSADFNSSSAAFYIEPLIANHDRQRVEAWCYDSARRHDGVTQRLRTRATQWREVAGLEVERLEALIRSDRIDILVDLNGHTRGNRLDVFARKPAPVQVTYLGYGATTGLREIDYRLTDRWIDPAGESERFYTEQLVRLPDAMWCFAPHPVQEEVTPLPAAANGYLTFAAFNNFSKVSSRVLETWARCLAAVPHSRLALLTVPPGEAQRRVLEVFAAHGVAASRLSFHGRVPLETYFRLHRGVDVALDPFPYTGGATTCHALWMGVPVLTLVGETVLARSGLSILETVGLRDWVARTVDEYVARVAACAADLDGLARLRAGLRARLLGSPMCREQAFVAHLEQAYRDMWRAWCRREDRGRGEAGRRS